MPIRELGAALHPELEYPGIVSTAHPSGKTYKVASPSAREGLRLTALANLGLAAAQGAELSDADRKEIQLDDNDEKDLYRRLLGPAYDEMLADDVAWMTLKAIANDALVYFGMSPEIADLMLVVDAQGEALARGNRATRRAAAKKPARTRNTGRKTAGSSSAKASTATPARTRSRASTRSSTSATGPDTAALPAAASL